MKFSKLEQAVCFAANSTWGWSLALVLLCGNVVMAQLPIPQLQSVYPPGAKQGAAIEVTVGGNNFDDPEKLTFSHPGITAVPKMTEPTEFEPAAKPVANTFKLSVAADVPPGLYEVRFIGRHGQSNPRTFVVSSMEESLEQPGNNVESKPQDVPVGTVVNGRCDGNAFDFYKVTLKKDQRVLIDCVADRIDSKLNPTILLLNAQGRELIRVMDTVGEDPVVDFIPPADGDYIIKLYDFVYNGGPDYFYRLSIAPAPLVDFVFPPAVPAGSNEAVTIYGRNLPGSQPADGLMLGKLPLEKLTLNIQAPGGEAAQLPAPSQVDVSPRTSMLDTFEYRWASPQGASNAVAIGIAQAPLARESEPNNTGDKATVVTVPADIAGQFFPERDIDWYQFDAKAGDVYFIEVLASRLGRNCDPSLLIQRVDKNDQGKETVSDVGEADDAPDRPQKIGSDYDTSSDDPVYKLSVPKDGTYRVKVRDLFGDTRRDPRFVYRLIIRKPTPDFRVAVFPDLPVAPPNPQMSNLDSLTIRKGGTGLLRVVVSRQDEFDGEIQLNVEGLPNGVTCSGATIDKKVNTAALVIQASDGIGAWQGPVRVIAKAKVGEQEIARPARSGTIKWGTQNRQADPPKYRPSRDLTLVINDKEVEPATIQIGDGNLVTTSLGGKVTLPVTITRRGEWKTPIKLTRAGTPDQIVPKDMNLDNNTTSGNFELELFRQDVPVGTYTFYMRAEGNVSYERNPAAIAAAEAEQKEFGDRLNKYNEGKNAATTARDQANQTSQQAKTEAQQAETARNTADAELKQKQQAAKQAADAAVAAKDAAGKDPANEGLKTAAENAQKAADEAAAQQKAAEEKFQAAEKALKDSQEKAKAEEEKRVKAEADLTAATNKANQAAQFKQQLDQRVNQIKQANQKKDVQVGLISTPVKVKIVPSPLVLKSAAPASAVPAGNKVDIPVTFERQFGFDKQVEVFIEVPNGLKGLQNAKIDVPADKADGKFEYTPGKDCPPGEYKLTLRLRGRWNNCQCDTVGDVTLKVDPPAAQ